LSASQIPTAFLLVLLVCLTATKAEGQSRTVVRLAPYIGESGISTEVRSSFREYLRFRITEASNSFVASSGFAIDQAVTVEDAIAISDAEVGTLWAMPTSLIVASGILAVDQQQLALLHVRVFAGELTRTLDGGAEWIDEEMPFGRDSYGALADFHAATSLLALAAEARASGADKNVVLGLASAALNRVLSLEQYKSQLREVTPLRCMIVRLVSDTADVPLLPGGPCQ
jgi:hypothetical protein